MKHTSLGLTSPRREVEWIRSDQSVGHVKPFNWSCEHCSCMFCCFVTEIFQTPVVICTDCIGSYKSNYHTTKNNHDLNRDLNYLSTKVLITVIGVHTFTQQYPRIPLEYPKIPQNTNNIKILKDFGFLFFFILLTEIFHRRQRWLNYYLYFLTIDH